MSLKITLQKTHSYLLALQDCCDVRGVDAVEVDGAEEAVRVRHARGRVEREPREDDLQHALLAHVHGEVALKQVLELAVANEGGGITYTSWMGLGIVKMARKYYLE